MAKTDAATEAKKRKTELKSKFGEFIPDGSDPEQLYKQWVSALFGKDEEADDDLLFRALTMAKLAGIDIRGGLLYIKDGNVIINIANEQNSSGWEDTAEIFDFRDPERILELARLVRDVHPGRLVGGGGYDHEKNVVIGRSPGQPKAFQLQPFARLAHINRTMGISLRDW